MLELESILTSLKNVNNSIKNKCIILSDKEGVIKYLYSGEDFLGYSKEELIGQSLNILTPNEINHAEKIKSYLVGELKTDIFGSGRKIKAKNKNGELTEVYLIVDKIKINNCVFFIGIVTFNKG